MVSVDGLSVVVLTSDVVELLIVVVIVVSDIVSVDERVDRLFSVIVSEVEDVDVV